MFETNRQKKLYNVCLLIITIALLFKLVKYGYAFGRTIGYIIWG